MAAKFYTDAELKTVRDKAVEIAAEGVANFYHEISIEFRHALFFTCMRTWGSGPAITCARLNSTARSQIINAQGWSSELDGVLLKKTPDYDFEEFMSVVWAKALWRQNSNPVACQREERLERAILAEL